MAMTAAEKKAAQRKRARRAGKCADCCQRKRLPKLTVCNECNEAAKIRVQHSRLKG
jgi:ribosomal protein L32